MNKCSVISCRKKIHGHGLCQMHYRRFNRTGSVRKLGNKSKNNIKIIGNDLLSELDRIISINKIDKNSVEIKFNSEQERDFYFNHVSKLIEYYKSIQE